MQEKSEGQFGGAFSGSQKQQNPHKAGFGDISYLGRGNLNCVLNSLILIIKVSLKYLLEYQLEYHMRLPSELLAACTQSDPERDSLGELGLMPLLPQQKVKSY